jgi:DNA-binding transcriptional MerR regulator
MQEWSIQDIARAAGTTSRTLRHCHEIGLLEPSRIGNNGYRYYNRQTLVRLQKILLLRELGLGLSTSVEVLDGERAFQQRQADIAADIGRAHTAGRAPDCDEVQPDHPPAVRLDRRGVARRSTNGAAVRRAWPDVRR